MSICQHRVIIVEILSLPFLSLSSTHFSIPEFLSPPSFLFPLSPLAVDSLASLGLSQVFSPLFFWTWPVRLPFPSPNICLLLCWTLLFSIPFLSPSSPSPPLCPFPVLSPHFSVHNHKAACHFFFIYTHNHVPRTFHMHNFCLAELWSGTGHKTVRWCSCLLIGDFKYILLNPNLDERLSHICLKWLVSFAM